jgi:hypothetical protein
MVLRDVLEYLYLSGQYRQLSFPALLDKLFVTNVYDRYIISRGTNDRLNGPWAKTIRRCHR